MLRREFGFNANPKFNITQRQWYGFSTDDKTDVTH